MKTSMHFSGGKELASKLSQLSTRVSKRVTREALTAGAEPVRRTASRLAPRRAPAPDLADNIVIGTQRAQQDETAAVSIGPAKGFAYGLPQEIGTAFHAAQPFMRPAFDQDWQKALGIVRNAFWTVLASVGVSRSVSAQSTPEAPDGGDVL